MNNKSLRRNYTHALVRTTSALLFALLFAVSTSSIAKAQASTDGATPLGLAPGATAGSYPLSDFDIVGLYNGGLSFRMPLYQIDGRGGAGYPITLQTQKKWTVHKHLEPGVGAFYYADAGWWSDEQTDAIFESGKVNIRSGRREVSFSVVETLTRITFTTPDGTEYELRDQLTNGQPVSPVSGGFNRGTVFVTADGTTATFVSDWDIRDDPTFGQGFYDDRPDGYLMLKDGTRYRVDDGKISWMRDRNGNKVTFGYDAFRRTTNINDSLNRQVTITYPATIPGFIQISFKGYGGAARTIKIGQTNLANALRSGYSMQTATQLFPELHGGGPIDSTVINYIEMPDGRSYQLRYNPYAELARVVLPTGGAIEYDYAAGLSDGAASGVFSESTNKHIYRRLIERRFYPDGASGSAYESKMTYSRPETTTSNLGYVISEHRNATGALLAKSQHYFHGSPKASFSQKPTHYGAWKDGKEYKTEVFDINGSTVLRRTEHTFAQRAAVSWWGGSSDTAPPNDPRTIETVATFEPASTNLVSKQVFGYDDTVPFNNKNNVKEYNFGTGSAGTLTRETRTTFITSASYTSNTVHLRGLSSQVSIYDGGNTERARTTYEYDNYATDTNHASLTNRANISGFDSTFDTSYTTRGNSTGKTDYFLVNGSVTGSLSTYSQYDIAGNVVKTIDARGYATNLSFNDCFGGPDGNAQICTDPPELGSVTKTFAFPTQVTNALNQSTYGQYDYYLGRPVDGKDLNGTVASGYFNDSLDRPTEVKRAVGTGTENRSVFSYDDANRSVTQTIDRDNSNVLISTEFFDKMGRSIEKRQYEGGTNYIALQTQYDALGRAHKVSNPFRPWKGETAVWTTTAFDALGRVISVTSPDNAVTTTSYSGDSITTTDPSGKQRKNVNDALERLVKVYEAPNVAGFNYLTTYAYDTLDNLISVTQDSQTRTFVYDSLKRLKSSTNPENGTIDYQYDNNGNLIVRTDDRDVSAHFEYDALNRLTRRWYNGSTSVASTTHNSPALSSAVGTSLEAKLYYDAQALPSGAPSYSRGSSVGRLVAQTYGTGSNGDYFAYDVLGRYTLKIQQIGSVNYQTSAVYDLSGNVTSTTYPSGHTISNAYDAAGRLTSFTGNLGDGTNRNYATEMNYSASAGLLTEKFGTSSAVYHKRHYNIRGQLFDVRASNVNDEWGGELGALINHYSTSWVHGGSGVDNNGNLLMSQTIVNSFYVEDRYSYDAVNRLTSVSEYQNGATHTGTQQYDYDRWGNRTINPASWGTGINNKQFTKSPVNNQLGVPDGQSGVMSYDTVGNLTNDTYTGAGNRTYDAENKITSAWGGNNQDQLYSYDGSGQRIKRTVNGVETWQVYGLGGELLAEYPANGPVANPQKEYGYRNGQLLVTAAPASNNSLNLNGTSSYMQAPSSSSLNIVGPITVEAWVKINAIGAYRAIISREAFQQSGTGGGYRLSITDTGKVRLDLFQTHNTYVNLSGATTITTGVWHHVAGVFDGSQMRIYLNGVLDGSLSTTSGPNTGTGNLHIGRFSYSFNPYYFNGLIDEARVSNTALYSSNFTPSANLTATGSTKGLWKFDGQVASDTSGNNNNGTLQGGASFSPDVPTGPSTSYYSGSFNGTSAYMQAPSSSSLNIVGPITVEAWVKINAIGAYRAIISREAFQQSGTGGGYRLSITDTGKVRLDLFQTHNTYVNLSGATTITTGVWHHVAGVFDGSQMRIYLNGVLDGTLSTTNGPNTGTGNLHIGRFSYSFNPYYFNGLIDEARVSNTALYSSNFTPQTHLTSSSSTKGLWKFDGQVTSDSSGNGNNVSLQGGATYSDDVPGGGGGGGASGGTGPQINWLVTDHLGTPRMIIDQTGTLANVKRHDYLPFGEELFAPAAGRSTALGYASGDGVRQQFTSKERDVETGLDYSFHRYYASAQGRFTTPDPYVILFEIKKTKDPKEQIRMLVEYLAEPQNWARYGYALNNPLRHTDPDGRRAPTQHEQSALNLLDQMIAWNQNNPDLANALRAARQEIARIIDGLAEGAKDVGVDVAVNAILNVFNSSYQTSSSVTVSIRTHRGTLQFTGNKCNILVAAAHAQGAGLGTTNNGQANSRGYPLVNGKPPAANWLGDARDVQKLTNIPIVTDGTLKPGDIVAWRTINGTGQGHSTIHIGGNVLIYAGGAVSPTVNTLSTVKAAMTNHEAPVVRRYNGKP